MRRTAAGLAANGFSKGDVLGIYSPNVPEYAVAFHAAASLGGISTTVNPLYTTRELAQQLTDCGAKFLLTVPGPSMDKRHAPRGGTRYVASPEIFVFGEAEGATPFATLLEHGDQPPTVAIDARNDLVALPYSSGTDRLAKGVMLTHRNLVAELNAVNGRPDVVCPTDEDTLLAFLPAALSLCRQSSDVPLTFCPVAAGRPSVPTPQTRALRPRAVLDAGPSSGRKVIVPAPGAAGSSSPPGWDTRSSTSTTCLLAKWATVRGGAARVARRRRAYRSARDAAGPGVRHDRGIGRDARAGSCCLGKKSRRPQGARLLPNTECRPCVDPGDWRRT